MARKPEKGQHTCQTPNPTFFLLHRESGVFGREVIVKQQNMSEEIRQAMEETPNTYQVKPVFQPTSNTYKLKNPVTSETIEEKTIFNLNKNLQPPDITKLPEIDITSENIIKENTCDEDIIPPSFWDTLDVTIADMEGRISPLPTNHQICEEKTDAPDTRINTPVLEIDTPNTSMPNPVINDQQPEKNETSLPSEICQAIDGMRTEINMLQQWQNDKITLCWRQVF